MNTDEVSATGTRAPAPSMSPNEYGVFLNTLLEAERAGAKLLAAYLDELPPDALKWKSIRAVQLDEARNCAVLIQLLLEAEVRPTPAVGSFYGRGLAVRGWRERVEFLNRGQAWVAKRLAAALPLVPERARPALAAMHDSHVRNIETCADLLRPTVAWNGGQTRGIQSA
jgi:nitronate monooxygenase